MNFWDNVKKLAQPYADDEYDEFEDEELTEGFEEDAEPVARPVRRPEPRHEPVAAERGDSGFSGKVLTMNSNKPSVVLFRPTSFNEATKAADDLRQRKAVIVNLENVDAAMARRVVDFLSGCAYALDGKVKKIALATYLFCPHSMDVMGDLETLQTELEDSMN